LPGLSPWYRPRKSRQTAAIWSQKPR